LLGFPAPTGYNWLDVVAEREVTALGDAPRSGRPPQLSDEHWKVLTAARAASPSEAGYDNQTWTPDLLRSSSERSTTFCFLIIH